MEVFCYDWGMQLYVARHTQTNYNVDMLCNADPSVDVHLTPLGIEQAQQLAQKLSGVQLDAIYISEFPRTKQTATYLEQYKTTQLKVDKRLNENIAGFEGQPVERYLEAFNQATDKWHAAFNGGESLAGVRDRVEAFLKDVRQTDQTAVLIITHGYIVECIHAILNNLNFDMASTFECVQGDYVTYTL